MNITICLSFIGFLLISLGECAPKVPQKEAVIPKISPDWYCATICEGGSLGKAHYDAAKAVCRCTIADHIDDGDMELIQKTAKTIGMTIKFAYPKHKRAVDEDQDDKTDKENKDKDDQSTTTMETTTMKLPPPKKFALKPLPPLFANLRSRFQKFNATHELIEDDPILGQMDTPKIIEQEPHDNIYAMPAGANFFKTPLLGQISPIIKDVTQDHNIVAPQSPLGFGRVLPRDHLTPALTRSLLMSVREKLDGLILRSQQKPYQPAITAHESESMRNTLKQITQVNVNVRPIGTTWGYFFNNLVNQAAGLLRQEAPNATLVANLTEVEDETTTIKISVTKLAKGLKHSKVPSEIGAKKTSTKSTSTTTTTPKFLPVDHDEDLLGEEHDYEYEDEQEHQLLEPTKLQTE